MGIAYMIAYTHMCYRIQGAYKDVPENILLQKWTGQNRTGDNFW